MNNIQRSPYLRNQRQFPNDDLRALSSQVDHAYIDIASKVNARTIGLFGSNTQIITGESWFLSGTASQQTLRQVYPFGAIGSGTELDIPTGITNLVYFTKIYGTVVTNMPDYRPLPYIDPGLLTNGMALLVGTVAGIQQIRIVLGGTAPPVTNGIVVLEWLSQV